MTGRHTIAFDRSMTEGLSGNPVGQGLLALRGAPPWVGQEAHPHRPVPLVPVRRGSATAAVVFSAIREGRR
jgi:hypothetical protein